MALGDPLRDNLEPYRHFHGRLQCRGAEDGRAGRHRAGADRNIRVRGFGQDHRSGAQGVFSIQVSDKIKLILVIWEGIAVAMVVVRRVCR